ncbi:MAG: sirohydrochlorin cobaltochelatase [Atopobiaceae bacterium]|nr:sirohydrochlorin cobaltochelatase [Atopobiaceae bacterium]MBR1829528.1 sirohydrochlorin cobaltochelatase [Atopobiaceae bacterium]
MFDAPTSRRSFIASALAGSAALLAGCSGNAAAAPEAASAAPKPVILVVSFGTSYASSRHATIGAIESDIREAYPDYDVRRAFTAQIIIDHIEKDTGRHIDNFEEAMDKIVADGVKELIVQPTHLMDGFEYNDIKKSLENYAASFDKCVLGAPLLTTEEDQVAVAQAIKTSMERYEDADTAICLMGHGTEAESNSIYATMQDVFKSQGFNNYFVATVEATPTFDDVATAAKEAGFTKAVLRPMMVVAGDHANNDMADPEDPESFISVMTNAGFDVTCVIEGLGQLDTIDEIYVSHVADAIASA